jgi:hypothetical protein
MDKSKRDAIAARLEKLAKLNGGRITPDAVVRDAKDIKSPLHDQFTWDDAEAAQQWRLEQARQLIRSVRVEIQTQTRTVSTVRYVRDPSAGEQQGYVEVSKLRTERDLARDALKHELRVALAWADRAHKLAEVLDLAADIDAIKDQVMQADTRLDAAA